MNDEKEKYPAPLTPQPSAHPLAVLWSLIGGVLLLVFLLAGIIAARQQFLAGAAFLVYVLVSLAIVVIPGSVIAGLVILMQAYKRRARIADLDVERAKALVAQEHARTAQLAAQAEVLRRTIHFDGIGNAALLDDYGRVIQLRGNYQEYPNLAHLHTGKIDGARADAAQLPPARQFARPTIEEIVSAVAPNSYQIILGRSLESGDLIKVELPDAHIKLIGGTRMGKSCESAAIIDQARRTHTPDRLLLALLDLENKTSRLFENDLHILTLNTPYKKVRAHARDIPQVAECLILLHELMLFRYSLTDAELARQPRILIYLEEFLYWKKLLGQFVTPEQRQAALAAFAGIATRGLKVGLHVMVCAQVDYADDELKDAMAQFLAINVAFSVRPSAAQAAGFVSGELLKRNYEARQPGQFVVEAIGGSDIGLAPEYDVRAKLQALQALTTVTPDDDDTPVSGGALDAPTKYSRNAAETQDRNKIDAALQAKLEAVMACPGENMADCIKRVWNAKPGDNDAWRQAKAEYVQVLELIHNLARRGMQIDEQES